jgi:outer membrane autotransporter protein
MKRLFFSRRQILRAIQLVCAALFLMAGQRAAVAQTYTNPPFVITGSHVTSTSGTYSNYIGFYDTTNHYATFSIASGTSIVTNDYDGYGAGTTVTASTASFTNAGTLVLNGGDPFVFAAVVLNQGANSVHALNTGTLSANYGSSASGLYMTSTSGNLTAENKGTLSASGAYENLGLHATSTSGNIAITNDATGHITAEASNNSSFGAAIQAATASGIITITNNGTVTAGLNDDSIQVAGGTGAVTVTNNATITGSNPAGIEVNSAGLVTVTNNGTMSGVYYGIQSSVSTAHPEFLTNNGSISTTRIGIVAESYGDISATNSGSISGGIYGIAVASSGTISVRNTGSISSSDYGIYAATPSAVYNTGSINAMTAISVTSGSAVTLAGTSPITGLIQGGVTSASTSTLKFALTVPAGQLAAAKLQLNNEITAYDAKDGGLYTFNIDGVHYDVSNFLYTDGILDDLVGAAAIATRFYADTPGFHSLGSVLDNLDPNNPQAAKILTALGNVSDAGLPGALAELSPKSLEVFRNVAFDNNTFNDSQINNHLANLRDGLTGFDSSALTIDDPSMDPSLSQVKSHLLAYNPASTPGLVSDTADAVMGGTDMKEMKSPEVNTMPTDRWSSFIAGDVILANLSSNSNLQNADYTTGSVTGGVDYRLDQHFTVGALLAYAHTDVDLDRRGSSATVDSYTPGIYGSYVDGGWYANGLGTYVRNAYTDDRNVDIAGISGDNHGATSGNQGTANLTGGYEFHQGSFKFGPVASLQYVHLAIQSIQEQGPTSLNINDQNQDSLRSLIGFEGRFVTNVNTPIGMLSLTPHLSASWQHEYLDDSDGITSQFNGAGGGSFSVQTDNPDRDSAFIDAGLDATLNKNVTIFVDYETQAGQDNFFAQSAQGGVKIGF